MRRFTAGLRPALVKAALSGLGVLVLLLNLEFDTLTIAPALIAIAAPSHTHAPGKYKRSYSREIVEYLNLHVTELGLGRCLFICSIEG